MNAPSMDPTNALARINRRLEELTRAITQLRAATGTIASATVGKGGLKLVDGGNVTSLNELTHQLQVMSTDGIFNYLLEDDNATPVKSVGMGAGFVLFYDAANAAIARIQIDPVTGALVLQPDNGLVEIAHTITGAAPNAVLDATTGLLQRSTSSARYKVDIADLDVDVEDVLNLRSRSWVDAGTIDRAEPGDIRRNVGFVAEEVDALPSMRQFVLYDDEGRPDALEDTRMTGTALLGLAKHQQSMLNAQQEQIDALTRRLDALDGGTAPAEDIQE